MADDTGETMITREQALACLNILGLTGPPPGPDDMSRAESLGHLLFLVEASAFANNDRLDQEALRLGYAAAANMVVTGSMGIEGDAGTLITMHLLARALEDRIRRTRLDLEGLDTPVGPDEWSPFQAISAALDGALALIARPAPPFVFESSEQAELKAMRGAIDSASTHLHAALSQLGEGVGVIERMTQT